jgi:methyl-accepting chemotaxis protein
MNALLSRLLLWQKFALLSILCLVLIVVPLVLYVSESDKAIDAARQEVRGLAPIQATLKVVQLTQQHRGLSAMMFGGNEAANEKRAAKQKEVDQAIAALDDIVKRLDETAITENWRQAKAEWAPLAAKVSQKSISGKDSFEQHTALITKQMKTTEFLLDHFGLTLDPEFETYYLISAALLHSPGLTETLAKLRGKGSNLLAAKNIDLNDRILMSAMASGINELYEEIGGSLAKAASADPRLKAKLDGPQQASLAAGAKAMQLVYDQIVKAEQLSYPPADYFAQLTVAIDAQIKLNDVALGELELDLHERAARLVRIKYALIAGVLLLSLIAALIGHLIIRSVTVPLAEAVAIARQVESGNLAVGIRATGRDEASQLMHALKNMAESLVRIVGTVRAGSDAITTASREIASGNYDLSSRTEAQASSLEQTASAMEELTSTVQQNVASAQQANELAASASEIASKGGAVVSDVVSMMGELNDSASRIVDIIGVIDGIAFQTNILALNAAVEAARAGEQGRGFAVVASEVRSLAQRAASAAKEIKALIDASSEKTERGSRLVGEAGATMEEIISSIGRVTNILGEIATASREQASGIEQINQAITQMDDATQQNAALVEEAAAAAQALQEQTGQLQQAVSVFRI